MTLKRLLSSSQLILQAYSMGKFRLENISSYNVLILLIILSIALRFFTFFPTLIDHDESTYLVIAKEILKGKVLYSDVTDIKPVGIFYITAGYLKLFGDSIFGYRVFGAFIIALTAFFLYHTKINIGHTKNAALATGVIYIIYLSIWTQYGVPLNTEHFFNLFTSIALWLIFSLKKNWRFLVAGFVIGIGFLIKIVVLFDFAAFFLFLIISDGIDKKLNLKKLWVYLLSGLLFLIPFGLINLVYFKTGHFSDFYQINYEVFGNYPRQKDFLKAFIWIIDFIAKFLPISAFFFWALFSKQNHNRLLVKEKLFVSIWIIFCLISVLLPGKRFTHYLIQLMLPVSFLAGNIFNPGLRKPGILHFIFTPKVGYFLLGLFFIVNTFLHKKEYYDKTDCPREISNYLEKIKNKDDLIFTGNAQHIIYFLLDISPPTKYVHPSLLLVDEHYNTLEIDPELELQRIFNLEPEFVLIRNEVPDKIFPENLEENYMLINSMENCEVRIYQLKPDM